MILPARASKRSPQANARAARAFTLMEVMMASVVLAFAVAAIAHAVASGQKVSMAAAEDLRAISLAEALMEEIVSKPYADPEDAITFGPDTGETGRTLFDNVDDYHGFTEEAGACADAAGVGYDAAFAAFARSVTVTAANATGIGGSEPGVSVVVTVTGAGGRQWTLQRFVVEPSE